jgi:hypothetical protein
MGGMLDSWQQLERWAGRHASGIRGEAKLISARADSLQQAIRLSEGLAVYWILRDFRELDLQGVVNDIVEVLRQCLVVMLTTTGGGALIGGIAGGIGGAGVGAIPGVVVGAGAGAQVGEWILIAMGLKALAEYVVKDMPDIARDYWAGIRLAWLAATPPPLPQQPVRVDRLAVYHAAEKIARAHVAVFVLLLMGIVAYLAKGRGSMRELAESVRASKVGPRFAEWMVRNEQKLKAEPRLRIRATGGSDVQPQQSLQRTPSRNTTNAKPPRSDSKVVSSKERLQPKKRANVIYRPANEVNATFPSGWKPPYQPGTQVTEYTTTGSDVFVRVHGSGNPSGAWMMRREAINGLTPQQIASKYSLPNVPTMISDVNVPSGTRIRMGKVGANFGGGEGSTQYQLLQQIPASNFTNTQPLITGP